MDKTVKTNKMNKAVKTNKTNKTVKLNGMEKMEKKIDKLFIDIEKDSNCEKYLDIILNRANVMKKELIKLKNQKMFQESMNEHLEDLFEIIEESNEPVDKQYAFDSDVKNKLKNFRILNYEYFNDDIYDYIDITISFNEILLRTFVAHRIEGRKDDKVYFTINFGNGIKKILYENYELYDDNFKKKIIDTEFNKLFNDNLINQIFEHEKNNFVSKETFIIFVKLLLTIPKIWFKYIY